MPTHAIHCYGNRPTSTSSSSRSSDSTLHSSALTWVLRRLSAEEDNKCHRKKNTKVQNRKRMLLKYTHSHSKYIVHDLLNACSNNTAFRLYQARTVKENLQFKFWPHLRPWVKVNDIKHDIDQYIPSGVVIMQSSKGLAKQRPIQIQS